MQIIINNWHLGRNKSNIVPEVSGVPATDPPWQKLQEVQVKHEVNKIPRSNKSRHINKGTQRIIDIKKRLGLTNDECVACGTARGEAKEMGIKRQNQFCALQHHQKRNLVTCNQCGFLAKPIGKDLCGFCDNFHIEETEKKRTKEM